MELLTHMPPRSRLMRKQAQQEAKGPAGEAPRDRFIRIARPRVNNILKTMRLLAGMNRAEYGPPSPEDIEAMIGVMEEELGRLREAFRRPGTTAPPTFDFPRRH